MSNNKQSLDQLWQNQQTQLPNLEELSRKFKSMRRKQWLYMSVDVISTLFLASWLLFFRETMNQLMFIFILIMTIFSLGATVHLVWLRRFALKNTLSNTQSYLQGLKNQYINNIKIAKFTKFTIWLSLLITLVFFVLAWLNHDWDTATAIKKTVIATLFIAGGLYPMWKWSNKRIIKYTAEVEKLESLEQSLSSEDDGIVT
ncbi:hypothetical protein EYS14_18845 [Alteromonadaceae bacterium M269]|nr:hypothetical protein EYS14_18845 [Alteromonadaceae bacterium M269]